MDIKILRAGDVRNLIDHVKNKYEKDIETHGESPIQFLDEVIKETSKQSVKPIQEESVVVEIEDSLIIKSIKALRLENAKKYKMYPIYTVFNNATITDIINSNPKTLDDLLKVKGLGPSKVDLFGQLILDLINTNNKSDNSNIPDTDLDLYNKLILERPKIAKFNKLKAFEVYSDQVAKNLSKMKPKKIEDLDRIFGFDRSEEHTSE